MSLPDAPGADWRGIEGNSITVRGTVPDGERTPDGYRRFYQSLIDDLNATAAALGWCGAAVTKHGFSLAEGQVEISAMPGKVKAELAHVKALAGKGRE